MGWDGVERRSKQDWVSKLIPTLAIIGWLLMAAVLILTHLARPAMETGLVRYHGIKVRTYWDAALFDYILYLLWFNSGLSLLAMLLQLFRKRRAEDRLQLNMILLLSLSAALLVLLQTIDLGF